MSQHFILKDLEARELAAQAEKDILLELKEAGYVDPKLELLQAELGGEEEQPLEEQPLEDVGQEDYGLGDLQDGGPAGECREEEVEVEDPEVDPDQQQESGYRPWNNKWKHYSQSWRSWRGGWQSHRQKGGGKWKVKQEWKQNKGYGDWKGRHGDWKGKGKGRQWEDNQWKDWKVEKKGKGKGKGQGKHAKGSKGDGSGDEDEHGFRPMSMESSASRGGHYVDGGFVDADGVFRPFFGCKMCCTVRLHAALSSFQFLPILFNIFVNVHIDTAVSSFVFGLNSFTIEMHCLHLCSSYHP